MKLVAPFELQTDAVEQGQREAEEGATALSWGSARMLLFHLVVVEPQGYVEKFPPLLTRLIKLWRDQHGLDFPSFYLELSVIRALGFVDPNATAKGSWTGNVAVVLRYLHESFVDARIVDPANTNNVVSDDLTEADKEAIRDAAARSLDSTWRDVIR